MIRLFQKVLDRGIFLSTEILFNRFVPAWLFRFSVGDLLELDLPKMRHWQNPDGAAFASTCLQDPDQRRQLRSFTWNTVSEETTFKDFAYAISAMDNQALWVGGVWVARESFLESDLGFQIMLAANQAWLYCAFVDKSRRGGGVYKQLLSFVGQDITDRGFERLLVVIQPWNKPSLRSHQRFTSHKVGRITVLRILRWSFVFCSGGITKNGTLTCDPDSHPVALRIV